MLRSLSNPLEPIAARDKVAKVIEFDLANQVESTAYLHVPHRSVKLISPFVYADRATIAGEDLAAQLTYVQGPEPLTMIVSPFMYHSSRIDSL